jgi:DNA-binding transcriptional ArsR family regulator
MDNYSDQLDHLFSALSDPTRRAIVSRLAKGPATVSELSGPFPMALPNFLKHVRILENSGLVRTQKQGRIRVCAIRPEALSPTEKWLTAQRKQMAGRLDRMEAYIEQLTSIRPNKKGTKKQ